MRHWTKSLSKWRKLRITRRLTTLHGLIVTAIAVVGLSLFFFLILSDEAFVAVPAKQCVSEGEDWANPAKASGRPSVGVNADGEQFTYGNSAAWQGGSGSLLCSQFEVPDQRPNDVALSFSLAVADKQNIDSAPEEKDSTNIFETRKRLRPVEPQTQTGNAPLDSLVSVWVSVGSGQPWEQIYTFDKAPYSNAIAGGYFSVKLPEKYITSLPYLQVRLQGMRGGEVNKTVLIDSLFLTYRDDRRDSLQLDSGSASAQRGSASIAGSTTASQSITSVDPSKTFVIATANGGSSAPNNGLTMPVLTSATNIDFIRYDTSSTATSVRWEAIEMDEASVQRNTTAIASGSTQTDVNITAVDLSKSFIIVNSRLNTGTANQYIRGLFRASFLDNDTIRLTRAVSGTAAEVHWQVVTLDSASVDSGTATMSGSSSATGNLSSVDTSKSLLLFSATSDNTGLARFVVKGQITNSTTASFTRTDATGSAVADWFAIEHPQFSVQRGQASVSGGSAVNQSITSVDTGASFSWASWDSTGTGTSNNNTQLTHYLSSATQLTFQKAAASQTNVTEWQVVEFLPDVPEAPTLYSADGSNQIAFNNIRQNSSAPLFRAAAVYTSSFDRLQLELNTVADFSGTAYTQTFSGTYSSTTQYNLDADSLSPSLPTTDNAVYYARARASADSGSSWSEWSGGIWSYTYKTSGDPNWFQTTDAQFNTGTLVDTETTGSNSVGLSAGSATPTFIQSAGNSNDSESSTISQAFSSNVTAGNLIVASFSYGENFGISCSDNQGNSYTVAVQEHNSGNNQSLAICYAISGTTGATTVTVSFALSVPYRRLIVAEYSGVASASPVDVTAKNINTATSPLFLATSTAATTTVAGDLIFGAVMDDDGAGPTSITAGSGFTQRDSLNGKDLAIQDQVQTSAGSIASTQTFGAQRSYLAQMVAFKAAGGGGASSGTITSPAVDYDDFNGATSWGEVSWAEDETDGSIVVQVYYNNGSDCDTIVPDGALSGNSSGLASSPIDISGLNTTTYNRLCARATLTDSGGSPYLQDWAISWIATSNIPPGTPTSLAQAKTDDTNLPADSWTNETSVKLSATVTDADGGDTIGICAETQPLGTPFTSPPGDGDGCSAAPVSSGNAATVTVSGLADNEEYHWQIKAKDASGAYSAWTAFGGGVTKDFGIDTSAPTGGTVYDGDQPGVDQAFNDGSLSMLSANWANFNFGVAGARASDTYETSVGTSQGTTDIAGWLSNGTSTSLTRTGLTLRTNQTYYVNVRAYDAAGNFSTVSSNGQLVAPSFSFSISPSQITFNNLNQANSFTDTSGTTLTTSTNAYGGYIVRVYATGLLTAQGGFTIPWFTGGTYASPALWGSNVGYGYTSNDTSIQGSNKFSSGTLYAPFTTTPPGDIVADHTGGISGSPIVGEDFIVTHRVTSEADQASGTYTTTIIYTATPEY